MLFECLESIFENCYSQELYEVIVIDDCSSEQIDEVKNYTKIKNMSFHILAINSGGASVPRNFGLCRARGDYVLFIDSDDRISAGMLARSMEMALHNRCDMVIVKKISDRNTAKHFKAIEQDTEYIDLNALDIDPRMERFVFGDCHVVGKILRRRIIEEYGISFPVDLRVNEDLCFSRFFWAATKIAGVCASEQYFVRPANSDNLSSGGMSREAAYNLLNYIYVNILGKPNAMISMEKKMRILNGRFGQKYVQRLLEDPNYVTRMRSNHRKYLNAARQSPYITVEGAKFIDAVIHGTVEAR